MISFYPGRTVATPVALEAMSKAEVNPASLWRRHLSGDWGDVCPEDARRNDWSIENGERVLSVYVLPTDVKVWIITEADRSATTFLLPSEY